MAASLTFAVLFFAGAAFSAGAGDMVAEAVDDRRSRCGRSREAPRRGADAGRGRGRRSAGSG